MPRHRQTQIVIVFIVVSLLLHAAFFAVASQYDFYKPEPFKPEKPRTITLRKIEAPEPPKPPPKPKEKPQENTAIVGTHEFQETDKPDPRTPLEAERNTRNVTRENPTNPDSPRPEMRGDTRENVTRDYIAMQRTPNAEVTKMGKTLAPQTSKEETQGKEKQTDAKKSEEKAEGKEPTKEKPVESEVTEKMEKVEKPQEGKADEFTELMAKANPNKVPEREKREKREYSPDALPFLKPEPKREQARPLQRVEDPEKEKQESSNNQPTYQVNFSRNLFDIRGGGERGDFNSPAARQTSEARYLMKVFRSIQSRYYNYMYRSRGQMFYPGQMKVVIKLRANGVVEDITFVDDSTNGRNALWQNIILKSIRNSAPFDVFPEDMKRKYGESYTLVIPAEI